jgi:integration host factor subunit beta
MAENRSAERMTKGKAKAVDDAADASTPGAIQPGAPQSGTVHNTTMTKSRLIEALVRNHTQLGVRDVELAVKAILEQMALTLASGERIEVRGFGSFSLHYRPPRIGRNPKSGEPVSLPAKFVPHFKPGKDLRERVKESFGVDPGAPPDLDDDG